MTGVWCVPWGEWDPAEFSPAADWDPSRAAEDGVYVIDELGPHVGSVVHELSQDHSHLIALFTTLDDAYTFVKVKVNP